MLKSALSELHRNGLVPEYWRLHQLQQTMVLVTAGCISSMLHLAITALQAQERMGLEELAVCFFSLSVTEGISFMMAAEDCCTRG